MACITDDLDAFSKALQHSFVVCSSDGKWAEIPKDIQRCHALIGVDHQRLNKIAKVFSGCLDRLERIPVAINCTGTTEVDLKAYLKTAEVIQEVLASSKSHKIKKSVQQLKGRVFALKERMGLGSQSAANSDTIEKVKRLAEEWKSGSHITNHESLNEQDVRRLLHVCENSGFAELLVEDERLRQNFFHWTLRDRVNPAPFMQFPATCKRLTKARLSHRIGFYGGEGLKVSEIENAKGTREKVLTLPMGGREISLLNDALEVEFELGYKQTVGQIIKIFENRQWEIGNVEFFRDGIQNWNPKRLGRYHPEKREYEKTCFNTENWWESLPVIEELTAEEAGRRFNQSLDGSQWVMALRAAREQENDTPFGIHGWMQVAIPIQGIYRLYDFGKYTEEFPRAWYEMVDITMNTVPAVISYPDEAMFASDRQHGWHSVLASPEEGVALMDSIKEDFKSVDVKNLAFQFISENCVKWAWTRMNAQVGDEKMPKEVVRADFTHLNPPGVMGMVFKLLRLMPFAMRWTVLTFFVCLLGAWRSMSIKKANGEIYKVSLLKNLPWSKEHNFFHPGKIFTRH
jgi:hypothetical protein